MCRFLTVIAQAVDHQANLVVVLRGGYAIFTSVKVMANQTNPIKAGVVLTKAAFTFTTQRQAAPALTGFEEDRSQ